MGIPVEASEIEDFTPSSLANLAAPPVFRLRAAGRREFRKYQHILQSEGLEFHDREDLRAEVLRALKSLYSPDIYEANAARLRAHWALIDQKGEPEAAETDAVDELTERLTREWRPLSRMGADNVRFIEESLRVALSMFLVGWSGVEVSYRREDGRVPLEVIDDLEDWLVKTEKQAKKDKVEGVIKPGVAFVEICNAASTRLHVTKDEEKNSSSPPSTTPDQSGSGKTPSRKGSKSKASASSEAPPTA
jgi:hypothetical protein